MKVEKWFGLSVERFFPRRLSFPKICEILVAYLNAGADREYIGVNDVVAKSSVNLYNISRNNNFLKSWGFIEESEKEPGKYMLTREAAEFASAYRIDPNSEHTKNLLRRILSKDEVISKLMERVVREGMDRNRLILELPGILGDLRADKVGLNAFVDMLAYAFQVESLAEAVKAVAPARRAKPAKPRKKVQRVTVGRVERTPLGINLSVTLSIDPRTPPERLKEYIKAILKAYEEYSEE